eukprot:1187500-Prorocentrum_minimum.AAC.3
MALKRNINLATRSGKKALTDAVKTNFWAISPGDMLLIPNPKPMTEAARKALLATNASGKVRPPKY